MRFYLLLFLIFHLSCNSVSKNKPIESSLNQVKREYPSLPNDFQIWPAVKKQEYLWKLIQESKYENDRPSLDGKGYLAFFWSATAAFDLKKTFTLESDIMPEGRKKFIHPYGVVAKAHYRRTHETSYGGLLHDENVSMLIRLSLAGDPTFSITINGESYVTGNVPGMALKFFVDKMPSQNLMVMHSLNGQGTDTDFFKNNFTNALPAPHGIPLKIAGKWFSTVLKDPTYLPLDHLTSVDKYPYALVFVPMIKNKMSSQSEKDFRDELISSVPSGTVLYRVFSQATKNGELKLMGEIITDSVMVDSFVGDKLFFQHHARKEDFSFLSNIYFLDKIFKEFDVRF